MILVTLGTHPQPMDRLVMELERLLGEGALDEEVVIQAAAFGRRPERARAVDVVSFDTLEQLANEADVIVTHGGPGSIMLALAQRQMPVVVPRDPVHGEHVDDHQLRFVRWLAERRPIRPVFEIRELGPAIADVRFRSVAAATGDDRPAAQAVERLRAIISGR